MADVLAILADHILRPAHVGFVVADLEQALAAACRVYGLDPGQIRYEPAKGEEAPTRFAFFTVGDLDFEYIEPRADHFREILLSMPSGGGGINHLAWAVRDIDGALDLLAARGVLPGHVTPDGVISIGSKRMVYLDPATTGELVIELIEYQEDQE